MVGTAAGEPTDPPAPRRPRRRVVRPGRGDPDPTVALRALDDRDADPRSPADDSNDDRLRRDVPPHW